MPGVEARPRVFIVGGGAAGVFTAALLERCAPERFEITILEEKAGIGGHAHSMPISKKGKHVRIDLGAQFFSEESQPEYCKLLDDLGILGDRRLVTQHKVGMTVWHQTRDELLFRVPNSLGAILVAAVSDPTTWLCFSSFVIQAKVFWDKNDSQTPFGKWLDSIEFPIVSDDTRERFKRDVARPLMYQFGLVAPDRLDQLSARFVVFYFLALMPKGLSAFKVYNSTVGVEGLMERVLNAYAPGTKVIPSTRVESVEYRGNHYRITTADGGPSIDADELILATNPVQARDFLPNDADHAALRAVLGAMEYVDVLVRIQHPMPNYMPTRKEDWSVANILVSDPELDHAIDQYMLTVWFGEVRGPGPGQACFKSWGSPRLHPKHAPSKKDHIHQLMVGTPEFMAAREKLLVEHQGRNRLWFVGGYVVDYDTQNSALRSAGLVVDRLVRQRGFSVSSEVMSLVMRSDENSASDDGRVVVSEPVFPERFPLIDEIVKQIIAQRPDHPVVQAWMQLVQ